MTAGGEGDSGAGAGAGAGDPDPGICSNGPDMFYAIY